MVFSQAVVAENDKLDAIFAKFIGNFPTRGRQGKQVPKSAGAGARGKRNGFAEIERWRTKNGRDRTFVTRRFLLWKRTVGMTVVGDQTTANRIVAAAADGTSVGFAGRRRLSPQLPPGDPPPTAISRRRTGPRWTLGWAMSTFSLTT